MDNKKFNRQEKTGWTINLVVFFALVAALLCELSSMKPMAEVVALPLQSKLSLMLHLLIYLVGSYCVGERLSSLYYKLLIYSASPQPGASEQQNKNFHM